MMLDKNKSLLLPTIFLIFRAKFQKEKMRYPIIIALTASKYAR